MLHLMGCTWQRLNINKEIYLKKILIVFGTRPEAIKMAPLVKEFHKFPEIFEIKVCVTAQHREMLDQVLDFFEIVPDYDLNIMKDGQDLYDVTSTILLGMKSVLEEFIPDMLFVHGDTTTTFSASLAAFYKKIPVAHIEAGLRSGKIYAPWPEEANRKLTSQITTYHFAPTESAKKNLLSENMEPKRIFVVGNSVIDALKNAVEKIENNMHIQEEVIVNLARKGYQIEKTKKIILVTGHRRESFGEGFFNICNALKEIATRYPDIDIVYPVHLNPNVQKPVFDMLKDVPNIYLLKPLEYPLFVYLMHSSYFILTDSGGIQEEAPSLGKPVLVMRETTERPEVLIAGSARLIGTSQERIVESVRSLLDHTALYEEMASVANPYGNGDTCEKIVSYVRGKVTGL